jgi:hypothetical protein
MVLKTAYIMIISMCMNVLILTPDAVGSTLLQRMLTIYMQFHTFNRPVINLHELTNGLAKYYSPEFNQELIGKKTLKEWGYYQSLGEITDLLSSVDHYKTSRLAHYHIIRRGDSVADQIPFYNYINENFYIIACRRANIFEHALSMTLNGITKKLNVYTAYEKIDAFYEIYQSGIALDSSVFVNQLNAYRNYMSWSDQHFNISSYFNYEQDIPRIEEFLLDLPVFGNQSERISWTKNFGISFNDWNKMHYYCSDIGSIPLEYSKQQLLTNYTDNAVETNDQSLESWPVTKLTYSNFPTNIKNECAQQYSLNDGILPLLNFNKQQDLSQYKQGYRLAQDTIKQMVNLGIMISGLPIKKQTLAEKQKIINNFDQLVEVYNQWANNHLDIASPITDEKVASQIQQEKQFWNSHTKLIN